ncbi:MAG TPA: type II toxin-antitoxin system RelE/ParE family toxin [Stellaceae bacterium]|nr:type II toxin-antitoxin system RelE/ParE family toxin [Stellaceae bacterium]
MEIVWLEVALHSLERAREYIAQDNPAAAQRVCERILGAVRTLADMPNLGRPGRVEDTRELVVAGTPYIVAYTVIDNQVMIIAVQHGARKWPDRF